VRVQAARFFSSEPGGLVDITAEDLVLDCYWLARWYHQSPSVFLEMPLSEVGLPMMKTQQINSIAAAARSNDGD